MLGGPDAPPPSRPSPHRCPPPPFSRDTPLASPTLFSGIKVTGPELSASSPGADQEDNADGRRDWKGGGGCACHHLYPVGGWPGRGVWGREAARGGWNPTPAFSLTALSPGAGALPGVAFEEGLPGDPVPKRQDHDHIPFVSGEEMKGFCGALPQKFTRLREAVP